MTEPLKNHTAFTPQQQAAIAGRGNLLVVAGAGTGKTRTLVARCLRLVADEGVSLENLLLVTFTEAAATEMRARIREGLRGLQAARPHDEHLAQQLVLLDSARISTLHSFCLQLAREHFHELGLDPQFSVLDEQQTRPLQRTTLDGLLERHYAGTDASARAVQALIRVVGRGADHRIRRLVLKLHEYSQSLPDPNGWLDQQQRNFEQPEPARWREWFLAAVAAWCREWQDLIITFTGQAPAVQLCCDALENLQADFSPADAAKVLRAVEAADADKRNWPRGTIGRVRDPLEKFFAEAEFLAALLPDGKGNDPLAQDWEWTRRHMAALVSLTREFTARFSQAKRDLGGLDFADLEQSALQLLRDPGIAGQWRARLSHVFVDEYQDINEAQDRIITALSRGVPGSEFQVPSSQTPPVGTEPGARNSEPGTEAGNRFLVGDVKQSIYRFRRANPKIFSGYDTRWSKPDADGQRLALTENFRSRAALLEFINPLFAGLMRQSAGGVDYEPLEFGSPAERALLAVKPNDAPCTELHIIGRAGEDAGQDEPEEDDGRAMAAPDLLAVEREARLLARRLRELKESGHPVWDEAGKTFRPVRWSDMAVLLRSPSGRAEAFAMEFSKAGVPLAAARDGFFETLEVSDLINVLRLLDNPLQDVPLLAVLRSPLVGLSLDELAEVRAHSSEKPFWTALMIFHRELKRTSLANSPPSPPSEAGGEGRGEEEPLKHSNTLREPLSPTLSPLSRGERETNVPGPDASPQMAARAKVDLFLQQFSRWRELVRQTSLSHCLETALAETQYEALLLAGRRGEEQAANVRRLLDLARQFDPYQRQGLYRFLRFVEAQEEEELDLQPAAPPTADAVRLMSVHRSKGLEFPVVALACLGTRFNEQDLNEQVLLNEHYGLCPKITPPDAEQSYPGLPHWLARRSERRELQGEELRLFYVALTRARDALILVGTANREAASVKWSAEASATDTNPATKVSPPSPRDAGAGRGAAEKTNLLSPALSSVPPLRDRRRGGPPFNESIPTSQIIDARSQLDWLLNWLPGATIEEHWHDERSGQNKFLRWRIYDEHDPVFAERAAAPVETTASARASEPDEAGWIEQVKANLAWHYPFIAATTEMAKSSVSTLRQRRPEERDDEARPLFPFRTRRPVKRDGRLSAAEIGSAHHLFLQFAAIETFSVAAGLKDEAERLRDEGVLTAEQTAALDLTALAGFWQADLGRKILEQRRNVHREIPFTARFSPADLAAAGLAGDLPSDEFLVVQGIADLAVILPQEIWLVDFKTDDVKPDELAARAKLYQPQLKLYALALSRIYRRPVTECRLYFLSRQAMVAVEVGPPDAIRKAV